MGKAKEEYKHKYQTKTEMILDIKEIILTNSPDLAAEKIQELTAKTLWTHYRVMKMLKDNEALKKENDYLKENRLLMLQIIQENVIQPLEERGIKLEGFIEGIKEKTT